MTFKFGQTHQLFILLLILHVYMTNVIVAGTFNTFHIGHESLISKALEIGDRVTICIMSDKYAKDNKNRVVPYEYRQKQVMNFLLNKHVDFSKIDIITSDNDYSCSFLTNFDIIVVSEETFNNANDINQKMLDAGYMPLRIVVVPLINDEGGNKISSTNIMNKETDRRGRFINRMSATLLGTSGGMSSPHRASAGLVVEYKGKTTLFDCGDMTSVQMMKSNIKVTSLDDIFISHAHIDHYIGLPMLIMHHMMLSQREKPLVIHAPMTVIDAIKPIFENYPIKSPFPVVFEPIHDIQLIGNGIMKVKSFRVAHSITDCYGFSISNEIGQKIVYSGDTSPCDTLLEEAHGADILFHEGTFTSDYDKNLYGHTTVKDAIKIGLDAQVCKIVLMHISLRYHSDMSSYIKEANSNVIPVEVGEDLKRYVI